MERSTLIYISDDELEHSERRRPALVTNRRLISHDLYGLGHPSAHPITTPISSRKRKPSRDLSDSSRSALAPGPPMNPVSVPQVEITPHSPRSTIAHIDISDDEDEDDDIIEIGSTNTTSRTISQDDFLTDVELRNLLGSIQLVEETERRASLDNRRTLAVHRGPGFTCSPGKSVELDDGSFLRIHTVSENGRGEVFVSGQHLIRHTSLGPKMPQQRNEIIWTIRESHEVHIDRIRKNRDIIFTNQQFPAISSETDTDSLLDNDQDIELGPLFCRYKITVDPRKRHEGAIEHLLYDDADDKFRRNKAGEVTRTRIADTRVRSMWRGQTILGGSHEFIRHSLSLDYGNHTGRHSTYTFGDAFCGAGGASRGALDAGLFVQWGFDLDEQAIQSYRLNFAAGGTQWHQQEVSEFIRNVQGNPPKVDVLHISPPCQPFSPAHTIPSIQRDERNQAALFSVGTLIETLKPRVVTLEETDGLIGRYHEWFSVLINMIVSPGYSVRWKVVRCQNYGVPQPRKRLVLIAAGPGEKLPRFPRYTHSKDDPRLRGLVTMDDVLTNVPPHTADHNTTVQPSWVPKPAFSGQTLAKTVTCKGGDNYHPSGLRQLSVRELAGLQTFPLRHSFGGARGITAAKAQVGNALPPLVGRRLFRAVTESLKESDVVVRH